MKGFISINVSLNTFYGIILFDKCLVALLFSFVVCLEVKHGLFPHVG